MFLYSCSYYLEVYQHLFAFLLRLAFVFTSKSVILFLLYTESSAEYTLSKCLFVWGVERFKVKI